MIKTKIKGLMDYFKIQNVSKEKIKKFLYELKYLIKPFIILCVIYLIAYSAIIRADFYYADDMGRALNGYHDRLHFSRYMDVILGTIFNANIYLTDISPLTQFIAIIFIALSSTIILAIFSENKKIDIFKIMAVLPLGLSPYFLECITYKFDAPFFAFSILTVVVPFLFIKNTKIYAISSFLGILLMLMTYQASSGIFPIIVLMLIVYKYRKGDETKDIINFGIVSVITYAMSLLIYKVFFMYPINDGYLTSETLSINKLLGGIKNNLSVFYKQLWVDSYIVWKILVIVIILSFIIFNIIETKKNRILMAIVVCTALIISLILVLGIYIILEKPTTAPRAKYCIGILISILAVYCCNIRPKSIIRIVCFALSCSFISFSFTYGNVLAEQKRYTEFRTEVVIEDLNNLDLLDSQKEYALQFSGTKVMAPILRKTRVQYTVLQSLVPDTFSGYSNHFWSDYYIRNYFDLRNMKKPKSDLRKKNLPIIKDTVYHKIMANDKFILVELK